MLHHTTDSILKKSKTNLDKSVILSFTSKIECNASTKQHPRYLSCNCYSSRTALIAFELESPVPKAAWINWKSLENWQKKKASGNGQKQIILNYVIHGIHASTFCFIPICIWTSKLWYPNTFVFPFTSTQHLQHLLHPKASLFWHVSFWLFSH